MFYRKEEVNRILVCGICSEIFKDPRLLPCSESACNQCIQEAIKSNPNKKFDCKFCHKKHTPPGKQGFPLNGALMQLSKAQAEDVYRNAKVEELKEKLADIKSKCEEFKQSLESGVDQVREHCIRLRNQVHFEAEILIEKIHKSNDDLIAEIDKYEQECIKSLDKNNSADDNEFEKFILELNKFHADNTKYLTAFKIDEKVVDEAVTKAGNHLKRLTVKNKSFKKVQFDNKIAEFKKFENEHDITLVGTLSYKALNFEISKLKKIKFGSDILQSYHSCMNVFKHDDGNNYVFYINSKYNLNMISFDNSGQVIQNNSNALKHNSCASYSKVRQIKVAQTSDGFIIFVKLLNPGFYLNAVICGHTVRDYVSTFSYLIKVDRNFVYQNHKVNILSYGLLHMATNSSNILCVDENYTFLYLDTNLAALSLKRLDAITTQVGTQRSSTFK
jgi:hypothetical protein